MTSFCKTGIIIITWWIVDSFPVCTRELRIGELTIITCCSSTTSSMRFDNTSSITSITVSCIPIITLFTGIELSVTTLRWGRSKVDSISYNLCSSSSHLYEHISSLKACKEYCSTRTVSIVNLCSVFVEIDTMINSFITHELISTNIGIISSSNGKTSGHILNFCTRIERTCINSNSLPTL